MAALRGLMSVAEVAEALGVSERRAYALVAQERLKSVRIGGHILVLVSSVRGFRRLPGGRPRKPKAGSKGEPRSNTR